MTATNIERRTVLTLRAVALSTLLIGSISASGLAQNEAGITNSPPNGGDTGSEIGV